MLEKFLPLAIVRPRAIFRQTFGRVRTEFVVVHLRACESHQTKSRRQARVNGKIVKRGQKLPLRQVARRAKHHDGARVVGNFAKVGVCSARFGDIGCAGAHRASPWKILCRLSRKAEPKEALESRLPGANRSTSDQRTTFPTTALRVRAAPVATT